MSVLYGLYSPDEGEMHLNGEQVVIDSPSRAIELGIGMVFQHFMLVPVMTVAENIVLADEPRKGLLLDTKAAARRVRELSDRFGLAVDPDARVADISVGTQQRVEILRALDRGADILILDEPTAVLTAQETQELFRILRTLTAEGKSIVFISHKLGEVLDIADRVSVLRRGKKVETVSTEGATEESLARMMVGRDVLFRVAKEAAKPGDALLEVADLEVVDDRDLPAVQGVSFEVRAGEIVGIAGVDDNGQGELVETLTGLRAAVAGTVKVDGRDVTRADVRGKLDAGIGHIAEDRHRRGLVLDFNLAENLCLRDYNRAPIAKRGLISPKRMNERAAPLLEEYDVRGGSCDALALSLSGGNQQKVVIAREIAEEPKVLIAAQPTRGLDVGAIEFVHSRLIEQRDAGRGVLLVSLELEEIRSLSDRVLVMYDGRVVAELSPEASEEEFGVAMLGGKRERRLRAYLRAGGIITPLLTALIAFAIGGLVIAITGSSPFSTYKAIFDGSGLNWFFPWISAGRPLAGGAEPAADAHRHDAADPHRHGGGLRVPRRAVQHRRAGPVLRRALPRRHHRVVAEGPPGGPPRRARAGPGCAGGRGVGWDRGLPEGADGRERGDLDDHAQLLRAVDRGVGVRPRRAAALGRRVGQVGADLQRDPQQREAAGVLG